MYFFLKTYTKLNLWHQDDAQQARSSSLLNPCQGPTSDKDTSHMQQEPTEDAYPCCCFLDLSYVTVKVDTFHGATRIRSFHTINIWTRATIVPSLACIGSYIALSHVTIQRLTIFLVIEPIIAYSTLGHLASTGSMQSLRPSMHQLLLFMSVSPTAKMPCYCKSCHSLPSRDQMYVFIQRGSVNLIRFFSILLFSKQQ